jgi:two-component system, cell cycle sensor histidine kinase PleC
VEASDKVAACNYSGYFTPLEGKRAVPTFKLVQDLPADLPPVQGDGRKLKQVLLNLLSNAVKFTPNGGNVTIGATHGPDGLRLIVSDSGIGIAAEDIEKAMRPFGQIDSRLARKYQGSGLGLPLARSITELHGGKLALESAPGRGTTAVVWLPAGRTVRTPAPMRTVSPHEPTT